jgi:hypothetical protein
MSISPDERDQLMAELNTLAKIWHLRHLCDDDIDEFWYRSLNTVQETGENTHKHFQENKILTIIDSYSIDNANEQEVKRTISESVVGVLSGYCLEGDDRDFWSFIGEHACRANIGSDDFIPVTECYDRQQPIKKDPFLTDCPSNYRLN